MEINSRNPASQEGLQVLLLDSEGFSEFMLELTVLAAAGLGTSGRILCSLTVERDNFAATVASSAAEAMVLDERQYALNHGPCLSALRGQAPVFVPELQASDIWTDYAQDIKSSGIAAIYAVPVVAGTDCSAALNCYAYDTTTMDNSFRTAVEAIALSFSGILRLALRIHPAGPAASGFTPEMDSRAVVDAAVGLLMIQDRCGREEAYGRLGRMAFAHSSRIRDEAACILWEAKQAMGRD